eukprot:gene3447-2510_t
MQACGTIDHEEQISEAPPLDLHVPRFRSDGPTDYNRRKQRKYQAWKERTRRAKEWRWSWKCDEAPDDVRVELTTWLGVLTEPGTERVDSALTAEEVWNCTMDRYPNATRRHIHVPRLHVPQDEEGTMLRRLYPHF